MRRLKTYPALGSVDLPRSAVVLAVHDKGVDQAPALLVSYDDADAEREPRRFKVLHVGDPVPPGAQFVASWRQHPGAALAALFELGDDIPADLPPETHAHYKLLLRDGFTLRDDRAWLAPDDIAPGQLSVEQLIAVATLQECGYGSVVNA